VVLSPPDAIVAIALGSIILLLIIGFIFDIIFFLTTFLTFFPDIYCPYTFLGDLIDVVIDWIIYSTF
jgi:hypothetical protein